MPSGQRLNRAGGGTVAALPSIPSAGRSTAGRSADSTDEPGHLRPAISGPRPAVEPTH